MYQVPHVQFYEKTDSSVMQGKHVDLGLWTSVEESSSFFCSCVPSLHSLYKFLRDRRSLKTNEGVVNESSARSSDQHRQTRSEGHSNTNDDTRRETHSVAVQIEMPMCPPPTYSASMNDDLVTNKEFTMEDIV